MPRSTCPKCGSVLQLTDDMVNEQIECGNCRAVFLAKPDPPASRRGPDEDRPSRRPRDDDEDRPSRRSRSRNEDEDEDEDYDRPRRRPPSGTGQGMGIASLVLGIISLPMSFCCALISVPIAVVGIILGIIGMRSPSSKGMAIAGTIMSGIGLLLTIIFFFLGFALNMAQFRPGAGGPKNPPFGPQRNNPPPPWKR